MATLDARTNSKGRTTYRVRWREGGTRTGPWQSATFTRVTDAKLFKSRVEANGHQWPDDATGAASIPGTITVDELADRYLTDRERRVRSDRTAADYRRDYTNWIAPTFGTHQIGTVTFTKVQAWVDGMTAGTVGPGRPLAAKSVHDRHALLSGMYRWAITRELVDRNPCETTDLPKRQKLPPKALTPAEWAALYAALRQIDGDAADLALFMVATGWRWSEATALTTYDVEDYGDGQPCYVLMSQVVRRNAAGQHVIIEEGKGESSLRRSALDAEAAEVVRRRVYAAPPGSLVFRTGISPQNGLGGSQWHYSNFKRRYWDKAVEAAQLKRKPTPHWLRHTEVVWAHSAGASMAEIQRRIGHANIATTIGTYGRAIEDVKPEVLERIAAMRRGDIPQAPAGLITQAESLTTNR